MELLSACMQCIPHISYNLRGRVVLLVFFLSGAALIGFLKELNAKPNLSCHPGKNVVDTTNIYQKNHVDKKCSFKYDEKYNSPLSPYSFIWLNFGFAFILCSILYAFCVKSRVQRWADKRTGSTRGTGTNDIELQALHRGGSPPDQANQEDDTKSRTCTPAVFDIFLLHLFARLVFMILFAVLFIRQFPDPADFPKYTPTNFPCPWPSATSSSANMTNNFTPLTTVNCDILFFNNRRILEIAAWSWDMGFFLITLLEAIHLLWRSWEDKYFRRDFEFCTIYLLMKRDPIQKIISNYKKDLVVANNKDVFNLTALSGKKAKIDKMYVNLIVQTGEYFQPPTKITVVKKIKTDLFFSNDSRLHKILVIGCPGYGKTVFTKKIIHESITSEDEFWREKLVLLFRLRKFNVEDNKTTTLKKMLSLAEKIPADANFDGLYEYIKGNHEKVILIFDGLDELNVDDQSWTNAENTPDHLNQPMPIFSVFKKLVCGNFLPDATVLITSRPSAANTYFRLQYDFDGNFEISGFKNCEIKEYVKRFYNNTHTWKSMWRLIEKSPELLSLCNIPMSCCIICLILEKCNEPEFSLPKTITELYEMIIKTILMLHNKDYKNTANWRNYLHSNLPEDLKYTLDLLKELAKDVMKNRKPEFVIEQDSKYHAIMDCGFFSCLSNTSHCFLHLTIQKFLAAKKFVDEINSPKDVESFLSSHIADPDWDLVIQFFAGLLAEKIKKSELTMEIMCNSFGEQISSITSSQIVNEERQVLLLIIKCLYEMQDCHIMNLAASKVDDGAHFHLRNLNITPFDCTVLFQFLRYVKNLLRLDLANNEHIDSLEVAKFLCENNVIELNLFGNKIKDEGVEHLCGALTGINENCKLTNLNLGDNNINDKGAKHLYVALINEKCKLTNLNLSNNNIKDEGVEHLCGALINLNCKLTNLNLSNNNINDKGVQYLCGALKDVNCNLEELQINNNEITDKGFEQMCDFIETYEYKLISLELASPNMYKECRKRLIIAAQGNPNGTLKHLKF